MRSSYLFVSASVMLGVVSLLGGCSSASLVGANVKWGREDASELARLGCPLSIEAFGAVADAPGSPPPVDTVTAQRNGDAITAALYAANIDPMNHSAAICREVVIPNRTYTTLPGESVYGLWHVSLRLDGTLNALANFSAWQSQVARPWKRRPLVHILQSTGVKLIGNGTVVGNGYDWWWWILLSGPPRDPRPYLLEMESCIDTLVRGWTLTNAPEYHVFLSDMLRAVVEDVTVHVDIYKQQEALEAAGKWDRRHPVLTATQLRGIPGAVGKWRGLPVFPLNTDGIDVSGSDIIVRRCKVTNFDDGVCVKPQTSQGNLTSCTTNLLFEDIETHYSVGMSVGSVTPDQHCDCVRNVTIRNVRMHTPIKAIYVKPNPPLSPSEATNNSSGVIDNVTYENFLITDAMWWSVWVSTQQQKQPGTGTNTGCSFFYPILNTTCPTDWRVPVTNLRLRNITSVNAWLSPGVLRCNEKGPCTGWEWSGVNITSITGWPFGQHFLCQGLVDPAFVGVSPTCIANYTSGASN